MKWLLFCAFLVLVAHCWAMNQDEYNVDYTGRYAELASPVPSHVNVDELVASLRAASGPN